MCPFVGAEQSAECRPFPPVGGSGADSASGVVCGERSEGGGVVGGAGSAIGGSGSDAVGASDFGGGASDFGGDHLIGDAARRECGLDSREDCICQVTAADVDVGVDGLCL